MRQHQGIGDRVKTMEGYLFLPFKRIVKGGFRNDDQGIFRAVVGRGGEKWAAWALGRSIALDNA
jgi:hypothetical protein